MKSESKILFMMPNWKAISEVWMYRMLEGLSENIAAIIVRNSLGTKVWREKIKIFSIQPQNRRIRYISKTLEYFSLSLQRTNPNAESILRRIIKKNKITHILCHYGTFAVEFMNIWRETELPLFVHFHGYDATFDLRKLDNQIRNRFDETYISKLLELSNKAIFLVNSKFTKSLLEKAGINSNRIITKYYGVPIPEQKHLHKKKENLNILHLGRLIDCKSPDRTIKAFEIAKRKGLDGKLIIAGDGPLRTTCELLKAQSTFSNSILILGEVNLEKAQSLILNSDIFTQHNIKGEISNQTESLGVSILEAMAAGLPVVGTNNGGVMETVIDGETGYLIKPGDVEAQADMFLKLANHPLLRQEMGNKGRLRIRNEFSPKREINQLLSIMKISQ